VPQTGCLATFRQDVVSVYTVEGCDPIGDGGEGIVTALQHQGAFKLFVGFSQDPHDKIAVPQDPLIPLYPLCLTLHLRPAAEAAYELAPGQVLTPAL
jgi:hypothetical protein